MNNLTFIDGREKIAAAVAVRLKVLSMSRELNFVANAGETTCLFGNNGQGKTLLLKAFCGIYKPYSGQAVLNIPPEARGVCLQFPEHLVYKESVMKEALLITGSSDAAAELLDKLELPPSRHPLTLSDGQKRLLFLYGYLKTKKIMLFDEPFASLDKDSISKVATEMNLAASEGAAVIYTANRKKDAVIADKTVFVSRES